MNTEIINTYRVSAPYTLIPFNRTEFYTEVSGGRWYRDILVEVVNIILFRSDGKIAIQTRSAEKNHNPGLMDKSIGGHITCGDTPKLTAMAETIQEMGTAAYVAENMNEFAGLLNVLRKYTNTVSILAYIETADVFLDKIIKGKTIKIGNRVHLYWGIYNGPVDFKDTEATGVSYFSLEELKVRMENNPEQLTDDLLFYINHYWDRLIEFRKKWLIVRI